MNEEKEQGAAQEQTKGEFVWLHVRLTPEAKAEVVEVADRYGVSMSQIIRAMTNFFLTEEPDVVMPVVYSAKRKRAARKQRKAKGDASE